MKTIRFNTFETNSSSTHALAICKAPRTCEDFTDPDEYGILWIRLDKYFTSGHRICYNEGYIDTGETCSYDVSTQIKYLVTQAVSSAINKCCNNKGNDYDKAYIQMQRNLSILRRKIIAPVYSELNMDLVKSITPYYLLDGKRVIISASSMPKLYGMGIGIDPDDMYSEDFASAIRTQVEDYSNLHWKRKTTLEEAIGISGEIDRQYGKNYDKRTIAELTFKLWRLSLTHYSVQYFYHT